jgi:N utilization substance protein B
MSLSDRDNFSYNELSRREMRSLIFHLIYAAEAFDYTVSVESIVDNFNKGMDLDIPLDGEALSIAQKIIEGREELDRVIEPLLDNWRLERIGVCTKLVLRLSLWEIINTDAPSSILINEAIELAKCFSEKDAYRFVNGILDEACKKYRADEVIVPVEPTEDMEQDEEGEQEELEFDDKD